jgi:CBS domain-containing protein
MAHVHEALSGVPVGPAVAVRFASASPEEPISSVAEYMLAGHQDDVPVVAGGRLLGVAYREDVLRAALAGNVGAPIASLMHADVPMVSYSEFLDDAFEKLRASGRRSIPVVRDGALVGILPIENVASVLQLQERSRTTHV